MSTATVTSRLIRRGHAGLRRAADALRARLVPITAGAVAMAAATAAASLVLFARWVPAGLAHGDAAVYLQQIVRGDLTERTVHIGYFLIGRALLPLLPGGGDYAFNLTSAVFAAATVGLVVLLAFALTGRRLPALGAALFLLTNYLFALNAVHAEVYVVRTFFLVLALGAWLAARPLLAGAALGVAVLVSPSSLFAVPSFVLLAPRWRPLVRLALPALALVAVAVLPVAGDYLFGPRGMLGGVRAPVELGPALLKEGYELTFGVFLFLPLAALGGLALVRDRSLHAYGAALASLWLVSLALGERFGDVPIQLPTYVLAAPLIALGWARLQAARAAPLAAGEWLLAAISALAPIALLAAFRDRLGTLAAVPDALVPAAAIAVAGCVAMAAVARRAGRIDAVVPVAMILLGAINGWLAWSMVADRNRQIDAFRDTVARAARDARPDHVVVGDWSSAVLFEHYLDAGRYDDHWIDGASPAWRRALEAGREVWLLAPDTEAVEALVRAGHAVERADGIVRAEKQ